MQATLISLLCLFVSHASSCGSKSGGPTDSPTETTYGRGTYLWADNMVKWNCTYNVKDYAGGNADASFAAAQDDALKNGGGVVYFPSGTYVFTKNITVASNIVIRGAPVGDERAKSGKNPGNLNPTTVFQCPNRAHQGIWNFDPTATNIGVVNVLLDQCAVMFWPGLKTSSFEPMMSNWWFDATDVLGMGSNKLVMGNVVRDVSLGKSLLSKGQYVYPYIFSIAIGVYSDRNALIANNLLPTSARQETTTLPFYNGTIPYMYDNRYGIDVNTELLGGVASSYCKGPGSKCGTPSAFGGLSPECAPWNFRSGLVIRDNWVAQNGRVGISWSGGSDSAPTCKPGNGTQVFNNHVEVKSGTTCYYLSGDSIPRGSDTNENRGYMLSGYCSNVTGNTGHINRQLSGKSGYETVDGEGILHQSQNGNWGYGDLIVGNDLSGGKSGYILNWDLKTTENSVWDSNTVNDDQQIGVLCLSGDTAGSGNSCKNNRPPAKLCSQVCG